MSYLRILNLGIVSSLESQGIYHAVASCMAEDSVDTIVICRPKKPYFCIGHHQNVRQVLNADYRAKLRYPVLRRRLGGGVTYLDDQQLFYQCIFSRKRSPATPIDVYRARLRQPIRMLNRIGVEAELCYINEIEVAGRRIAGIGGGLIGEASVVVGNVLNDFNIDVMSQIINSPCDAFRELARSAMLERITTLKRECRAEYWPDLPGLLIEQYCRDYPRAVYFDELSTQERDRANSLARRMSFESYLTDFMNELSPRPLTRLKISASTSIELIQVRSRRSSQRDFAVLKIKDNVIEEVRYVDDLGPDSQALTCELTARELHFNETRIGLPIRQ